MSELERNRVLAERMPYGEIQGINWSTLKHLETSPLLLKYRLEHPQPDSKPMLLGRAIHCAVLEPKRWHRAYVRRPDFGDGRTKEAKSARAAWMATLDADTEVLEPDDYALAERCAAAVRAHPAASRLLVEGRAEETLVWRDEPTGQLCKARADFIAPAFVLDLKSSRVGTVHELRREMASRLYHGQLAYYLDGAIASGLLPPDATAYILAVQTSEPYDVAAFRMSYSDLDRGRRLYRTLLRRYAECSAACWWPGIAPSILETELPVWAASGDAAEEW